MSESDSDEFLSAEEDSVLPLSNNTYSSLQVDMPSEQLETVSLSAGDYIHSQTYNFERETILSNEGDLVDTLLERDIPHVLEPIADHSADKSKPVETEQLTAETPTSEDIRSVFDPVQLKAVQTEVLARKETGNCLYREQDFSSARNSYSSALELCPRELSTERAILFSNRSLCLLRLEELQLSLADCSQALLIDSQFKKAKVRRAYLYERTGKLEEALSDYSEVLAADPACPQAKEAVPRLTAEVEAQREALKTEALSKLRDLGDMVLKPFGISTNDFNFVQDPNTGNYSVSFGKNS